MRRPIVILSAAALATSLALAGCGDTEPESSEPVAGDEGDGDAGGGSLLVEAHDIEFDAETYDAAAGSLEVSYVNEGAIPHTLVIEDVDGFKLEVQTNGDEDQGTVELEAGTYTIYCDIAGHRDAGMEATLEVS